MVSRERQRWSHKALERLVAAYNEQAAQLDADSGLPGARDDISIEPFDAKGISSYDSDDAFERSDDEQVTSPEEDSGDSDD
jgi:hypothetical protein